MNLKSIGVDLAKQVFQLHGVDSHEQVRCRRQLKRTQILEFFRRLGHEVRLIAPQFVKELVRSAPRR